MSNKNSCNAERFSTFFKFARHVSVVVFLGLSIASAATVNSAQAQTYRFNSVQISGNDRIDDATILSYAGITRGSAISAAQLNDGYQRILGSGLFNDVEFVPRGGRLTIRVVEFPVINQINVEGNRKISDEEAATVIKSVERRVFNPGTVEQDAAALTDMYHARGQLAATVRPKIIQRNNNRVDVVFEVSEGRAVEIERLSFVGNRVFSDSRLRRVLETKQAGFLRALIRRDTFTEDRIPFDKQVLNDFYQSRGYVDFRTLSVASEFSRERNAFFLTFNIREGQKFDFGNVTAISDLPEVIAADFLDVSRISTGQTYSPSVVDATISRMEHLAIKQGLSFVRVEPRVTRNDRDLTLDIEFALVRGPRIFVERIDIEGNATTLDRVVRRQFDVVEGDPFNPRQIRAAAERIRALGLFSNADVNAREGSTADRVIVDVDVEEQTTGSLTFGASYNLTTGIGFTGNFRERNFLGRGQTLNADLTFGLDNASGGIDFIEPAFLGRDLRFRLKAHYRQTSYDHTNYDTQTMLLSPSFEFPISENGRFAVRYALANETIFNVDGASSQVLKDEEADGARLSHSLGFTFSYDTRRSGFNPNAGVVFRFGQDFGGLGDSESYLKSTALISGETKVFNDQVTLRATIEGGALQSFGGGSTRLNDRFFLTSTKMRGFAPAGVGPRDLTAGNQDALGGNYFAVARLETEFPLGIPEEYGLTGGLFADFGSVWGLDNTGGGAVDDDMYLRSTVGISIHWRTALGPLRFNFSRALQKESYDEEQRFDLTISTQF